MNLQEMLLKKEELPILHETCFYVPIHPKLLSPDIKLDETIASRVFPAASEDWYNDLSAYAETSTEISEETRKWIKDVFLKKKPKIIKEYGRQALDTLIYWKEDTRAEENGFISCFSINRNSGGSLYFNGGYEFEEFVSFKGNELVKFSKEKLKEFGIREEYLGDNMKGVIMNVYRQHNIDNYPGALFLRNWAIAYMNEVFKQIC